MSEEGERKRGQREGWKDRKSDRRDADEDGGVGGGVWSGGGALLALCHIEVWEFTLL